MDGDVELQSCEGLSAGNGDSVGIVRMGSFENSRFQEWKLVQSEAI